VFSSFAPLRPGTPGLKALALRRQCTVTARAMAVPTRGMALRAGPARRPPARFSATGPGATAQHCTATGRQPGEGTAATRRWVCPTRSQSAGLSVVHTRLNLHTTTGARAERARHTSSTSLGAPSPTLILLAKSAIRMIYVRHEPENQICQRTNSCEIDFASSIAFGEAGVNILMTTDRTRWDPSQGRYAHPCARLR
jgi:hypothetical protein